MQIEKKQTIRQTKGSTALRNHNRTVFEEMTSLKALTWYIGMKTAFYTKLIKSKYVSIFIMMIGVALKPNLFNLHFLQSLLKFKIFIIKIR